VSNMMINGRHYSGKSVSVSNGKVIIDGKVVQDDSLPENILKIEVTGDLISLDCDAPVSCEDVKGNVKANGPVNCDDVGGNVNAGGPVNCDSVGGSITASGPVIHS
jgi:hypothetical protein